LRNNKLALMVAVALTLSLMAGVTVALAQDAALTSESILSTPAWPTPMVLVSSTHALGAGEANVTVTETLGGMKLMVKVTDTGRQPDPFCRINVYGSGFFGSRNIRMALVSPGVWAGMANLANIDEVAVRVTRPGSSRVLYVGIPGERLGWRCEQR
jgi:hypothetical protein